MNENEDNHHEIGVSTAELFLGAKFRRSFSATLAVVLTVLLASCGGNGSNGGGGGSSTTFVPGKWSATLYSGSGLLFANTVELDLDLVQSGNTISSDSGHSVDSATCSGMHVDSSTGTVSGNQFRLVFTIDSERITLTGTLSADGKSITEGKFTSSGGTCISGAPISFSAGVFPLLSGPFAGDMQIDPVGAPGVTASLTEDSSFNVTGSMTVTNDPCFSSLAIAADDPGISVGDLSSFEMTDGANVLDFVGRILEAPGTPNQYDGNFTVTSGCTEESGVLQMNFGTTPPGLVREANRSGVVTHRINPLLIERMKALAKLQHIN
jgi:hypothetical protein